MNKQPLNSKGFGLTGITIVVGVVIVLGGAATYIYHKNHKSKVAANPASVASTSNKSNSSQQGSGSAYTTQNDPYAGWKTYTDTTYHYSFKYPAGWTATSTATAKVGDTGGVTLLNSTKTVQVTYSNAFVKDSSPIAFTPSDITKLSSANENLTVVGGYSPAGGLVGNYLPSYHVIDSSLLSTYPLIIGKQAQFPSNPGFTDYNTAGSNYTGAFVSKPAISINTVADAQSWLNSTDAKASLLILESFTYQQ
jgi:hypothetical protein